MSKITVADIRAKYPKPMTSYAFGAMPTDTPDGRLGRLGCYCVLGACSCFLKEHRGFAHRSSFPSIRVGGIRVLLAANPSLDKETALTFAGDIVDANDAGNFELAWAKLDEALAFGQQDRDQLRHGHWTEETKSTKCTCDIMDLMRIGCKCGALEK